MPELPPDPTRWRNVSRHSLSRLLFWTLPRRIQETVARVTQKSLVPAFQAAGARVETDPGQGIQDTAVTSSQLQLLLAALEATENLNLPLVEIGSYRGMTTQAMAKHTRRPVVAVDPYVGDGGHTHDYNLFQERNGALPNVQLMQHPSGEAFRAFPHPRISMVFIDAIHEYAHAKYDYHAWSSLVADGGIVAFHDSDKFPGVNRVCHWVLQHDRSLRPWAIAPNLAIFQKRS